MCFKSWLQVVQLFFKYFIFDVISRLFLFFYYGWFIVVFSLCDCCSFKQLKYLYMLGFSCKRIKEMAETLATFTKDTCSCPGILLKLSLEWSQYLLGLAFRTNAYFHLLCGNTAAVLRLFLSYKLSKFFLFFFP